VGGEPKRKIPVLILKTREVFGLDSSDGLL